MKPIWILQEINDSPPHYRGVEGGRLQVEMGDHPGYFPHLQEFVIVKIISDRTEINVGQVRTGWDEWNW